MQRRLSIALLLFLSIILVVQPVLATTEEIWLEDDFQESHWLKTVGFAVFYDDKITLIAPSTNKTEIWYYETLDSLNNGTYPTTVYVYVEVNITYQNVENVDQIFNIHLKGTNDVVYDIGLGRYNSTKYYYQIRNSQADEHKAFVSSLPSEFIVSYDSNILVIYDIEGNIIETIETPESTWDYGSGFKEFGFGVWKTDHVDITAYAIANSLQALTTSSMSRTTRLLMRQFIPLILTLAMISVAIGLLKRGMK